MMERFFWIRLVDLVGLERVKSIEVMGVRLREGSNINKLLIMLGRVIVVLVDLKKNNWGGMSVVLYWDLILMWLFKDSLGGNSKMVMIVCVSFGDYEEMFLMLWYVD